MKTSLGCTDAIFHSDSIEFFAPDQNRKRKDKKKRRRRRRRIDQVNFPFDETRQKKKRRRRSFADSFIPFVDSFIGSFVDSFIC